MRRSSLWLAVLPFLAGCATVAVTGTPLEKAVAKGDAKEVEALLNEGADPNRHDLVTRISPSCRAIRARRMDILEVLLKHGANIIKESDALYCAVDTGQLDVVKFLIEHGAPVPSIARLRAQDHQPEILAYLNEVEAQRKGAAKPEAPAPAPASAPAPTPVAASTQTTPSPVAIPTPAAPAPAPAMPPPPFSVPVRPLDAALIVAARPERAELAASRLAALGYPPERTIKVVGAEAGRAGLAKAVEGRLPRLYKDGGTVFVYFAVGGAAAKGVDYLIPVDGDPGFLEQTAYPVARLIDQIAALHSRLAVVALDAPVSLPASATPALYAIAAGPGAPEGVFSKLFFEGLDGAAKGANDVVTLGSIGDYIAAKSAAPAAIPSRQRLAEVVLH